jgi:hypothetical protein
MNIEKREIDGKTRTVGTIEIDWNDKKENVELIALSFGEDLRIRNKCTKVKMATGTPDVTIDQEKMTLMNLICMEIIYLYMEIILIVLQIF